MKELISLLERNDLKLLDDWVKKQENAWSDEELKAVKPPSFTDLLSKSSQISAKLTIKASPFGTGIFTREAIKTGDRLVSIDIQDLIIDNSSGINHPFFKKFPQLELIYVILSTPKHASYLKSLPKMEILPMYYSSAELDLLKHSLNFPEIVNDYILQFKQYSLLLKILADLGISPNFGFKKFQWARQVVLSRHNEIKLPNGDNVENHYCLAPGFDLFNHAPGPITGYFDVEKLKMVLDSGCDYEKGSEVFMSYGERSNHHLFIYMGFCVENNQGFVPLSLTLPKDGLDKRLEMVNGYTALQTFKVTSLNDDALRKYLDVMLMPALELKCSNGPTSRSEKYLVTWVKVQIMKLKKSLELIDKSETVKDRKETMKAYLQSELDFMQSL